MKTKARELVADAHTARDNGQLRHAGNLYTASAYEYAGEVTTHDFPAIDGTHAAVSELCSAALCYLIAGDDFHVQIRCDVGELLADDYVAYIDRQEFDAQSFADLRRGAWPEFVGDLRTIARRDDADEAYDRAHDIYESAGNWEIAMAEQEHMRLTGFFRNVREGLGHDLGDESDIELRPLGPTFTDWLEYKRERLPTYLNQLEAQGTWPVK